MIPSSPFLKFGLTFAIAGGGGIIASLITESAFYGYKKWYKISGEEESKLTYLHWNVYWYTSKIGQLIFGILAVRALYFKPAGNLKANLVSSETIQDMQKQIGELFKTIWDMQKNGS